MSHTVYYSSDALQALATFPHSMLEMYLKEVKRISADPEGTGALLHHCGEHNPPLYYFDITFPDRTGMRSRFTAHREAREMFIQDVWPVNP